MPDRREIMEEVEGGWIARLTCTQSDNECRDFAQTVGAITRGDISAKGGRGLYRQFHGEAGELYRLYKKLREVNGGGPVTKRDILDHIKCG